MMRYEIEKPKGFGSTWVHVIGKNAKQETMVIEIVHCENPGGNNSLPYLWHKEGWTDKVMETYIGCNTYVHDSENGCYGGYNVTEKFDGKRNVINFDCELNIFACKFFISLVIIREFTFKYIFFAAFKSNKLGIKGFNKTAMNLILIIC